MYKHFIEKVWWQKWSRLLTIIKFSGYVSTYVALSSWREVWGESKDLAKQVPGLPTPFGHCETKKRDRPLLF